MKKKTNPRRKPATQADVKKAKHKAAEEAVRLVVYMVLYVLIDKHNAPQEDIQQLARNVRWCPECAPVMKRQRARERMRKRENEQTCKNLPDSYYELSADCRAARAVGLTYGVWRARYG